MNLEISLPHPLKLHQRISQDQYTLVEALENLSRIVPVAECITFASLSLTAILNKNVMVAWFSIILRGNAQLPAAVNVGLPHNSKAYDDEKSRIRRHILPTNVHSVKTVTTNRSNLNFVFTYSFHIFNRC